MSFDTRTRRKIEENSLDSGSSWCVLKESLPNFRVERFLQTSVSNSLEPFAWVQIPKGIKPLHLVCLCGLIAGLKFALDGTNASSSSLSWLGSLKFFMWATSKGIEAEAEVLQTDTVYPTARLASRFWRVLTKIYFHIWIKAFTIDQNIIFWLILPPFTIKWLGALFTSIFHRP